MDVGAFQTVKLWLAGGTGLAKDALHIHVGLALLFGCALAFRWPLRSWKPWLVVLAAALLGEIWDIRDRLAIGRSPAPAGHWKDIWNTLLWPSVILALARVTSLFAQRSNIITK